MDFSPLVGAGSVAALMALSISFVLSTSRGQGARIDDLEKKLRASNRRNDQLILICRQNGFMIPPEFWQDEPAPSPRRRHRRTAKEAP